MGTSTDDYGGVGMGAGARRSVAANLFTKYNFSTPTAHLCVQNERVSEQSFCVQNERVSDKSFRVQNERVSEKSFSYLSIELVLYQKRRRSLRSLF